MLIANLKTKILFIFFILIGSLFSFEKTQASEYIIQQVDPNFPVEKLKGKGIEIRTVNDLSSQVETTNDLRKILKECGLEKETTSFDAVDIDQLFLRAKHFDVVKLQEKYPRFEKEKLKMLKEKVMKNEGGAK